MFCEAASVKNWENGVGMDKKVNHVWVYLAYMRFQYEFGMDML